VKVGRGVYLTERRGDPLKQFAIRLIGLDDEQPADWSDN
jgi:hypothetical protein